MRTTAPRAKRLNQYAMNSAEAAEYLAISLGHLYNLLTRGRGPAHIKYGGQLRFRQNDLDDWVIDRCHLSQADALN